MNLYDWAVKWGVSQAAIDDLAVCFNPQFEPVQGGMTEAILQATLRVEAVKLTSSLWRNNRGAMLDKDDRLVRYGLANDSSRLDKVFKSSDLIGITPVTWYGRKFGVFTAVECKAPQWEFSPNDERAVAQRNFLAAVQAAGGIALFAQSVDAYKETVRQWRG